MAAKTTTIKRILKEASELTTNPSPDLHASPLDDSNLFEWHFTIRGPPSPSPFSTGIYHGRITLPPAYPLRPPSFRFLTPSGRFEPNREICLSISGHHEETWQPAWGIRTALVALRSFMDTDAAGQVGGMSAAEGVRTRLAEESRTWVCAACGRCGQDVLREQEELCREMVLETREEKSDLTGKIALVDPKKEGEVDSTSVATIPLTEPPSSSQTQPAPPTQTQPQPTPTRPAIAPLAPQPQPAPPTTDDWIDKAIIGLVLALVFMVLRRYA